MSSTNIYYIGEEKRTLLDEPVNNNVVYISDLRDLHTHNAFRNFSIKCALTGTEYYKLADGKEFKIEPGNYLIASKQPGGECYFKSHNLVKGICIDIESSVASEAFALSKAHNKISFDEFGSEYFHFPNFFERKESLSNSRVGQFLQPFMQSTVNNTSRPSFSVNEEWFIALAVEVVLQEGKNALTLSNIQSLKASTRKELLHRLHLGKQYIEENYLDSPDISVIAKAASLSKVHFFRSFQQAFKITPYKYMLDMRLTHAMKSILSDKRKLSDISFECGFTDLPTFSKAFKRKFGMSPRTCSKENENSFVA